MLRGTKREHLQRCCEKRAGSVPDVTTPFLRVLQLFDFTVRALCMPAIVCYNVGTVYYRVCGYELAPETFSAEGERERHVSVFLLRGKELYFVSTAYLRTIIRTFGLFLFQTKNLYNVLTVFLEKFVRTL